MLRPFCTESILGRAQEKGIVDITLTNIRDFSTLPRKQVDDTIFGGGSGMLLRPEPLAAAITDAKKRQPNSQVIFVTPSGKPFTQKEATKLASQKHNLILVCGRYEGIDSRIRETLIDEEYSFGNFVLTGGELPAAAITDAVTRLLPGALGDEASAEIESFSPALFGKTEFPQFTRPETWEGISVPPVLKSGHHAQIEDWQLANIPNLSDDERMMINVRRKQFPRSSRNLRFRLPEKSDIDLWERWVNDTEVTKKLILDPPFSREDEEWFFEEVQCNLQMLHLTILDKKTKIPIGNSTLTRDVLNPRSADLGLLIGEKEFWGKGLGTEIIHEMTHVGFSLLDLERIHARVFGENTASRRIFEKCGFREVGVFSKEILKKDGFHDCVFLEKLRL